MAKYFILLCTILLVIQLKAQEDLPPTPVKEEQRLIYRTQMPDFGDSLTRDTSFIKVWRDLEKSNFTYQSGLDPSSIRVLEQDSTINLIQTQEEQLQQQKIFRLEVDEQEYGPLVKPLGSVEYGIATEIPNFQKYGLLVSPSGIITDQQELIDLDPEEEALDLYLKTPSQFDSRVEVSALNAKSQEFVIMSQRAQSVFCVAEKDRFIRSENGDYLLVDKRKLGESYNLCDSEPYINQPTLCLGTAFLIGKNVILSSRHVFDNHKLEDLLLIRSFLLINPRGDIREKMNHSDIYELKSFIGEGLESMDVALIEIDQKTPMIALKPSENHTQENGMSIYALGHPVGLPMKLTFRASVRSQDDYYLYTTLDTFQGNSGSPVFSRDNHSIIGMLVGGGVDFETNGNCLVSHLCLGGGCGKEKVLRMDYIWPYIKPYLK